MGSLFKSILYNRPTVYSVLVHVCVLKVTKEQLLPTKHLNTLLHSTTLGLGEPDPRTVKNQSVTLMASKTQL